MNTKEQTAITALLTARSITDAARKAGVSEATLRRWLKKPQFRQALENARAEIFRAATGRLASYATVASDVLGSIMLDKSASHGVRVRAANCILKLSVDVRADEMLNELQELTEQVKGFSNKEGST